MGKSLVVVESPTKAKTINKILGKDYVVKSCMGHVRDLPPKELGIDIENGFKPRYVTIRGKGKILGELRKAAQGVDTIYLATDPDREGEAIAWHVAHAIARKDSNIKRMHFNQITPKAVRESLEQSGELNLQKVNAQQARRVLDRLVGYEISPLLWKVIHSGLSAGRVQSVAVRLICERDREIEAFEPQEYWSIETLLGRSGADPFRARLLFKDGEKLEITNQEQTDAIVADLRTQTIAVKEVKKRDQLRRPAPPFTTSTLQQECARRLRFSVKRTMAVAQQLYEGIELEGETRGLITYMRTDSVRVAEEAITEVRQQVGELYGADYVPDEPNQYKTKKTAQDAHEAIRPTSVALHPDKLKELLSQDQAKVYELIWKRFVASQMKPQVLSITTVNIEAGPYLMRATGNIVKFPGFTLLYSESKDEDDEEKPGGVPGDISQGEALELKEVDPEQHFTKPPPRFTEASLVKELEAQGIGRPSTYAQIITTIIDREYVEKVDNRYFEATERGQTVNKLLVDTFPDLFNVDFTANMEDQLDRVEEGDDDWVATVEQFYNSWKDNLAGANERRKELKLALQEESDIQCEECERMMVIKWGRNGRFLACPGYPECKNTKPLEEQGTVETDEVCDQCQSPMVVKTGRYGRFLACSGYPDCKNVKPYFLGIKCPEDDCGGALVEKQSRKGKVFFGCNNYPSCKFASWDRPVDRKCDHCNAALLYEKSSRSGSANLYCRICNTQHENEPENSENDETNDKDDKNKNAQAA
ncbi:MAG: type I DNA topoisomerase [Gemmatimonadetes bacterium]|jgi:DNA topoisomerase-1|nr:type I DNA topoisomerase [Gemmatimonadota bacterium]MBT5326406.1 type I DNA topoisomerase [Gemmatimonadota bacterium]MBT5800489.1 type I DNA topoisomerase [Gemmatimonadota bacterium]MBT6623558.1 type I DNA topoisomerase [Gemmatimonadota bacterium]MBT6903691.1 type I DNA topoisomerase [Gemmatimonadota bacterium]